MALGAPQQITPAGLTPVYATPSLSDSFAFPDSAASRAILHVKNAGAGACTVTVTSQARASDGLSVADKVVSVPATTGDRFISISQAFVDDETNEVAVAFSTASGVTAAVLFE